MESLQKDILSPFVPRIDKIILDVEDKKCLYFRIKSPIITAKKTKLKIET